MSNATTAIHVPTRQVKIVLDAVIDPPLRKLSIEEDGTVDVEFIDDAGQHYLRNRLAGQDIIGQIVKVHSGGSLTVDQMMGER